MATYDSDCLIILRSLGVLIVFPVKLYHNDHSKRNTCSNTQLTRDPTEQHLVEGGNRKKSLNTAFVEERERIAGTLERSVKKEREKGFERERSEEEVASLSAKYENGRIVAGSLAGFGSNLRDKLIA
ncbi:hypothetical protein C5167_045946 [Papaver somniferum]|uniref:Uncharacterized protein n=1 Tax=Papaver somniferum TaxID=3469 RepID=A0A4Y7LCF8_PAPSO|nr:hypothetical protein C5167_045946 [Papaver somniferum]